MTPSLEILESLLASKRSLYIAGSVERLISKRRWIAEETLLSWILDPLLKSRVSMACNGKTHCNRCDIRTQSI